HVVAVVAQILKQNESFPPHLLKAFLLGQTIDGSVTSNSGGSGIDHDIAWGRLDAYRSVFKLSDEYLDSWDVDVVGEPGSGVDPIVSYIVPVPVNSQQLVATLVWSDLAGDASGDQSKTLFNDLDLRLQYPNGSLLSFTDSDDSLNNVEKYVVSNPVSGNWTVFVNVVDLNGTGSTQEYAVKFNVIRRTRTPDMTLFASLLNGTIYQG
ncbi:hypothetical protein COV11_04780, partial [Candidatus Woesearchaeota archaeon CG10_big_fil_rev_8_21_14_0_10_30_7]